MKKTLINGLVIIAIAVLSISCKKEDDPENVAPVVSVKLSGGALVVTATDDDGSIAKVEFYESGDLKKTVTSAPYKYGGLCGNQKFTIMVYDNDGAVTIYKKTTNTVC